MLKNCKYTQHTILLPPNHVSPSEVHARPQEKHNPITIPTLQENGPRGLLLTTDYVFYPPGKLKNTGIQRLKLKRRCPAFFSNRGRPARTVHSLVSNCLTVQFIHILNSRDLQWISKYLAKKEAIHKNPNFKQNTKRMSQILLMLGENTWPNKKKLVSYTKQTARGNVHQTTEPSSVITLSAGHQQTSPTHLLAPRVIPPTTHTQAP